VEPRHAPEHGGEEARNRPVFRLEITPVLVVILHSKVGPAMQNPDPETILDGADRAVGFVPNALVGWQAQASYCHSPHM